MDYVPPLAINLLGYVVGLIVGTVLHEFGHAITGHIVGFGPRLISIGRGPIVWRTRLGPTWLVVRRFPIGGYVARLPRGRDRPWATAAVVAAGPAVNLVLFAALSPIIFGDLDLADVYPVEFVIGLGGAQGVLGAASLIPRKFRSGRDRRAFATDGLKLWQLLRNRLPDDLLAARATFLAQPNTPIAALPPPTSDTAEILYQLARRDLALDRWARRDSVEVLRAMLAKGRLGETEAQAVRTRLAIADAHPDLF